MSACRTGSGLKVYIQPDDIWAFYQQNQAKLNKEMCLVAENTETKYDLRLDIENSYPLLRVFHDGEMEYGQYIPSSKDAPSIMRGLVLTRLCPVIEDSDIQDDLDDDVDEEYTDEDSKDDANFSAVCQAMIDMREERLGSAVGDFLSILLNDCSDRTYQGEIPEVILDSVCKILARRFKISVFRPTWVPSGEGAEETYDEYPYLDTDKPGVIAGEPNDYRDATDYLYEQLDDDYEEHIRDDFPVS